MGLGIHSIFICFTTLEMLSCSYRRVNAIGIAKPDMYHVTIPPLKGSVMAPEVISILEWCAFNEQF